MFFGQIWGGVLHIPTAFCTFAPIFAVWYRQLLNRNKTYGYMTTKAKVFTSLAVLVLLALAGFIFVKFCFVYSEGTNEGDINYFQREGFLFKTYEGKMIQTGYNSKNTRATIQSNEFKFSVTDEQVARQIDNNSGRQIKLHWKRYLGTLPWRGNSPFIVDSIISVAPKEPAVAGDPLVLPVE